MSIQTQDRIAPYEQLANAPVGTRFSAAGKFYTLADGYQIECATGKAWFNATAANGRIIKVRVTPRTAVALYRY